MSIESLALQPDVSAAIRRHGSETYPNECCGALIGSNEIVADILALPNTTSEGPRRRFLVRPEDYRAAEARATELKRELLGFYHSHPDVAARPSQYDLDHAWPSFSYVIVSVMQGQPVDMTCWRLAADRSQFEQMQLSMLTL